MDKGKNRESIITKHRNRERKQSFDGQDIRAFIKSTLLALSGVFLVVAGFYYLPDTVATMSFVEEKKLPIYCVETEEKKVALSFDAAWGNEDTENILEILEKHDVHVTFFMTGGWIEKYPDDVKVIAAAGHDLGNHSENHKHMSQLSKEQCVEELMKPHAKVKELTGIEMTLFRPPYGDYNDTLIDAVNESGYHCIQWDVEEFDTKVRTLLTIIH